MAALNAAKSVVEELNSIFAFRQRMPFRPVQLTGAVFEGMPDGSRRPRPLAIGRQGSSGRVTFQVPLDPTVSVGGVPIPSWEEIYLKAVEAEPLFGEAMTLAKGSIADVCRSFETIKRRGKPGQKATHRGYRYIEDQGWLTSDDLTNLNETCKPGRHGLPSEPLAHGVELSLEHARSLVRHLLDRWAQELAHHPPYATQEPHR